MYSFVTFDMKINKEGNTLDHRYVLTLKGTTENNYILNRDCKIICMLRKCCCLILKGFGSNKDKKQYDVKCCF